MFLTTSTIIEKLETVLTFPIEYTDWSSRRPQQLDESILNALQTNFEAVIKGRKSRYNATSLAAKAAHQIAFPNSCFVCGEAYFKSRRLPERSEDVALRSASCCDELQRQWSSQSSSFESIQTILLGTTWQSKVSAGEETFANGQCDGPFTQLKCETVKRALCVGSSPSITLTRYTEKVFSSQTTSGSLIPFPVPQPRCEIPATLCTSLWNLASYSDAQYAEALNSHQRPKTTLQGRWPSCKSSSLKKRYRECNFGEHVDILYYPLDIGEDEHCSENLLHPDTQELMDTQSQTSKSLPQSKILALFPTMSNKNGVGGTHYNVTVELQYDRIGVWHNAQTTSFELPLAESNEWNKGFTTQQEYMPFPFRMKDLAYVTVGSQSFPLVGVDRYARQVKCDPGYGLSGRSSSLCNTDTIFHDWQPRLQFGLSPSQLAAIDPEWKDCGYMVQQAWDPPIVLSRIDNIPTLTLPFSSPTKTSDVALQLELARPGSSGHLQQPEQTNYPDKVVPGQDDNGESQPGGHKPFPLDSKDPGSPVAYFRQLLDYNLWLGRPANSHLPTKEPTRPSKSDQEHAPRPGSRNFGSDYTGVAVVRGWNWQLQLFTSLLLLYLNYVY
jgi:hypothetical protein